MALALGQDMIFTIDWQGFRQMRAAMPEDVVGVFLLPPSLAALEDRLRLRGQDSAAEIARRMASTQSEMEHYTEFDYAVVNERFADALKDLRTILRAARLATFRRPACATSPAWRRRDAVPVGRRGVGGGVRTRRLCRSGQGVGGVPRRSGQTRRRCS